MPIELAPSGNGLSVGTWKTDIRYCPTCLGPTHPFEDADTTERAAAQDIGITSDYMLTVSRRFRGWLEDWGVERLRFRRLSNGMSLMQPLEVVRRDLRGLDVRTEPPCPTCFTMKRILGEDMVGAPLLPGQRPIGPMELAQIDPPFGADTFFFHHLAIGDELWDRMRAAKTKGVGNRGPLEQPAPAPPYRLAEGNWGNPAFPLRLLTDDEVEPANEA